MNHKDKIMKEVIIMKKNKKISLEEMYESIQEYSFEEIESAIGRADNESEKLFYRDLLTNRTWEVQKKLVERENFVI